VDITNTPHTGLFWEELEEIFGPILRPILDPVLEALQDTSLRMTFLSTIVTFVVVLGGMIFLIYEGPVLIKWIGLSSSEQSPPLRRSPRTTSPQSRPSSPSQTPRTHTPVRPRPGQTAQSHRLSKPERPKPVAELEGVRVISELRSKGDLLEFEIVVNNGRDSRIDMVVVNVNFPRGLETASGSFRMQRLGTVHPGTSESVIVRIRHTGGDITQITGYVEFMGAAYQVTRITIPPPTEII
ncbi:MAG: hypothetical protein RTU30_16250, partial [Candidatus Thorarchaeota archaeon]